VELLIIWSGEHHKFPLVGCCDLASGSSRVLEIEMVLDLVESITTGMRGMKGGRSNNSKKN